MGGGGKTTLMRLLGKELGDAGKRTVLTTTTAILPPEGIPLVTDGWQLRNALRIDREVCMGRTGKDGKVHNPGTALLEEACLLADRLLIEADGARHMPIKAPGSFEPVIPAWADSVVAVAGLSALGETLGAACFRSALASHMLGVGLEEPLTPALLARLLTSPAGQRKRIPPKAGFCILLNQADDMERVWGGIETAHWIKKYLPHCRVVIASLHSGERIKNIFA